MKGRLYLPASDNYGRPLWALKLQYQVLRRVSVLCNPDAGRLRLLGVRADVQC
jgi:hypothetical protein